MSHCVDVRNKHPELIQDTIIEQSVLAFSSFIQSGQSMDKDNVHRKERNKLSNKRVLGSDDATGDAAPDAASDAASDGAADAVDPLQVAAHQYTNQVALLPLSVNHEQGCCLHHSLKAVQ